MEKESSFGTSVLPGSQANNDARPATAVRCLVRDAKVVHVESSSVKVEEGSIGVEREVSRCWTRHGGAGISASLVHMASLQIRLRLASALGLHQIQSLFLGDIRFDDTKSISRQCKARLVRLQKRKGGL